MTNIQPCRGSKVCQKLGLKKFLEDVPKYKGGGGSRPFGKNPFPPKKHYIYTFLIEKYTLISSLYSIVKRNM